VGKLISICNQKGGVGKTTTAINLSAYLALLGKRVLLLDLDPQGNATSGVGINKNEVQYSIYSVLLHGHDLQSLIREVEIKNLFVIPSNPDLSGAEVELVEKENREFKLKDVLVPIKEQYDYIYIDCPPSLGLLTINALSASDSVLIPLQCEYYALEGLSQLLKTIDLVKQNLHPAIEIEGLLLTMADFRTKLTQEVIEEARKFFKEKVYNTVIPRSIRLGEAPSHGKPIALYSRESLGASKYEELAKEILNGGLMKTQLTDADASSEERKLHV